jgi:hypothetical protein
MDHLTPDKIIEEMKAAFKNDDGKIWDEQNLDCPCAVYDPESNLIYLSEPIKGSDGVDFAVKTSTPLRTEDNSKYLGNCAWLREVLKDMDVVISHTSTLEILSIL